MELAVLAGFVLLLMGAARSRPGLSAAGALVQLAAVAWL